jgi:hypothetical protein
MHRAVIGQAVLASRSCLTARLALAAGAGLIGIAVMAVAPAAAWAESSEDAAAAAKPAEKPVAKAATKPGKAEGGPAAKAASKAVKDADVEVPPIATPSEFVTTVSAAERIPLPRLRGPIEVHTDALRATVILTAPRDLGALAARVSSGLGNICPRWEVDGGRILLRCRTRQISAAIVEDTGAGRNKGNDKGKSAKGTYLDIRELRGLPQKEPDEKLQVFYDPARVGVGVCPGTLAVAKGECALKDGNREAATSWFQEAWATQHRAWAALRLGDIANDAGDLAGAAVWWARAGSTGAFGRLARGHLCEVRGDCFAGPTSTIFDAGEIAEPMRTELALRAARIDLFGGRTGVALRWIRDVIARGPTSGGCVTLGRAYCRRLILAALEEDRADGGKEALDVYLSLPDRTVGPLAYDMARAAADRAAPLGAPVFAANLYASVAGMVPKGDVPAHLVRMIELYLAGEDRARAQLVIDYADSRFEPRQLAGLRWATVRKRLAGPTAADLANAQRERIEREIVGAEAAQDLANAVRVLARSKSELP